MNHNRHITLENSNIIVKYTNERIIPASGLAVVGALLGKSNFTKKLNSGNDSIDNVAVLIENGCYFIIKWNMRKESREEWFQMAKRHCQDITTPREGKTVYVGSDWKEVTSKWFEKDFTLRAGYEITERTIDKKRPIPPSCGYRG